MSIQLVSEIIKSDGPITACALAQRLAVPEKVVRNRIDALRAGGEPIWHDPLTGGFWWDDDREPGATPRVRWKREFKV